MRRIQALVMGLAWLFALRMTHGWVDRHFNWIGAYDLGWIMASVGWLGWSLILDLAPKTTKKPKKKSDPQALHRT